MKLNKNIVLHEKKLSELNISLPCFFLLNIDNKSVNIPTEIIYNITEFKDIYSEFLDTYQKKLYNKIWCKYSYDNIHLYLFKEFTIDNIEHIYNEVISLFIDIYVTSLDKNITNLYTCINFKKFFINNDFIEHINKLSEQLIINIGN